MHKNASKEFIGIALVDEEVFNNLYRLVGDSIEQKFGSDELLSKALRPKIEIEMRNGEKLVPSSMEETFEAPNRRSNPIEKITISGGMYGSHYIRILLGGGHYSRNGADIYASSETKIVDDIISRSSHILDKEKGIFETFISINLFVIGLYFTIFIHLVLGIFSKETMSILYKDGDIHFSNNFGYLLVFWAIPIFFIGIVFNFLTYYYFGRAAFIWRDGSQRHEKMKTIWSFVLWSVPAAFLLKFVTSII